MWNSNGQIKALWKDAWREILRTKARFAALIGIIILGTGFFVGIRSAAPDMRQTASQYYQATQLADLTVSANYGLGDADQAILDDMAGIQAFGYATVDAEETKQHHLFKLYPNFNATVAPNQFQVISGHLPQQPGEIALDAEMARAVAGDKGYRVGDQLHFQADTSATAAATLKATDYTVVGFVQSPLHIDRTQNRGYTSLGKGTLDAFAVVAHSQIIADHPSAFAIQVDEAKDLPRYSQAYAKTVNAKQEAIQQALKPREEAVYMETLQALDAEIVEGEQSLQQTQAQLAQGEQALTTAKQAWEAQWNAYQQQLQQAWQQYPSGMAPRELADRLIATENQLTKAKQTLTEQEADYRQQKATAEAKLLQAEEQLAQAKQQRDQLPKPNDQVTSAIETGGVKEYGENADRIAAIAEVFPWVFFLVATLVSFTTMTRMVDDERTRMGTLKALGYTEGEIAIKFLLYALLACAIGSGIGIVVGTYLFPMIIYNGYQLMYALPDIHYQFYATDILMTVGIALLTTVGPTLWTLRHNLRANAARLMRPKPPKQGQHILLERWTWLWRKLSFLMKITLRNLFRYKGRNLMTVIGILGCTGLMVTGFGISDSISGLPEKQFTQLETNDAIVTLTPTASEPERAQALEQIANQTEVIDSLPLSVASDHVQTPTAGEQTVNVRVLAADGPYANYYRLRDVKTNQSHTLPEDGALISSKLAELLALKVNDTITVTDQNQRQITVPVRGIVKSYFLHDLFISQAVYRHYFGELPEWNTVFLHTKSLSDEAQQQLAQRLNREAGIANVTYTRTLQEAFNETITTLDSITVVLIIAAAALAFIVLYSLQNINVSERLQELSTIKVLGAYAEEVTLYIYRETLILTVIGILLGLGVGYGLTTFILKTVEVDIMVFPTAISFWSYLKAGGLSFLFSAIVMGIMHQRLRHVDMVAALKGVE